MTDSPLFLPVYTPAGLNLCGLCGEALRLLIQLTQEHSQTSEQSGKSPLELKLLELAQAVANCYSIKSSRKQLYYVPKPQLNLQDICVSASLERAGWSGSCERLRGQGAGEYLHAAA